DPIATMVADLCLSSWSKISEWLNHLRMTLCDDQ
nr:hypothetical protein [Tanacetum cinerariifolium]